MSHDDGAKFVCAKFGFPFGSFAIAQRWPKLLEKRLICIVRTHEANASKSKSFFFFEIQIKTKKNDRNS